MGTMKATSGTVQLAAGIWWCLGRCSLFKFMEIVTLMSLVAPPPSPMDKETEGVGGRFRKVVPYRTGAWTLLPDLWMNFRLVVRTRA